MSKFHQVGHPVLYHLTESDQQLFGGNHNIGENSNIVAPGHIVDVCGDTDGATCNLKLMPDSEVPAVWKTSITMGQYPGQFELLDKGLLYGVGKKAEQIGEVIAEEGKKIWNEIKGTEDAPTPEATIDDQSVASGTATPAEAASPQSE